MLRRRPAVCCWQDIKNIEGSLESGIYNRWIFISSVILEACRCAVFTRHLVRKPTGTKSAVIHMRWRVKGHIGEPMDGNRALGGSSHGVQQTGKKHGGLLHAWPCCKLSCFLNLLKALLPPSFGLFIDIIHIHSKEMWVGNYLNEESSFFSPATGVCTLLIGQHQVPIWYHSRQNKIHVLLRKRLRSCFHKGGFAKEIGLNFKIASTVVKTTRDKVT